jgi:hypothetical protein
MNVHSLCRLLLVGAMILAASPSFASGFAGVDLRGKWEGEAQGPIFGAKGTVTITSQRGEAIEGIVEGGNFLGTARFGIRGTVRGHMIYGGKDGNVFQGAVYADQSIRGTLRAIDGDVYHVFLRRSIPSWGGLPYGTMYQPYGYPYEMW